MNQTLLDVNDLTIAIRHEGEYTPAVTGVSFAIRAGETLAVLGESGCGKSLTSLAIMQLLPDAARIVNGTQIHLDGQDLTELSEVALHNIRGRDIGMVFQEPMSALNPVFTNGQQVAEVLERHRQLPKAQCHAEVIRLFETVGLADPESVYDKFPHQISGGMKQRVLIAMAVAASPKLLIADEPTSALDVTIQHQILDLLAELKAKNDMAMLFITHDLSVVKTIADRVVVMYAGQIVEEADCKDFFVKPLHPYSQMLFASLPSLEKRDETLVTIPGRVPPLTKDFKGCRFADRCNKVFAACHEVTVPLISVGDAKARCLLYDDHYHPDPKNQAQKNPAEPVPEKYSDELGPQAATKPLLSVEDLKIHFPIHKGILKRTVGYFKAVDGVSFTIAAGETLCLVGESGSGKSTLAKGILQLVRKTAGEMYLQDLDLSHIKHKNQAQFHQDVQIIFQDPFSSMNPRMLVQDIIAEGMEALKLYTDKHERRARIQMLLQQVGLSEDSGSRYPHEFSGGQRQRIAIARALAVDPKLIVCDEPTSALDVSVKAQILNLLKRLQREHGIAYLIITHNMAVVAYMADNIMVMKNGKIVEAGPAKSILLNPQHPYTKLLLRSVL